MQSEIDHQKFYDRENEILALKKMLLSIATQVAEFERETITLSLHDDVGMLLTIVKLNLDKISRNPSNIGHNGLLLKESMGLLSEACQAIRDINKDVIPPSLKLLGYEKGILELCKKINLSGKIKINANLSANLIRLEPLIELYLYRIIQELISNIIKHANSTEIKIEIHSDYNGVKTILTHNGKGISNGRIEQLTNSGKGLGLKAIENRIELISATIEYVSNQDETKTIITVPVYEEEN